MQVEEDFFIYRSFKDGTPNRRFYKLIYTSALRLGLKIEDWEDKLNITLSADFYDEVEAHGANKAVKGRLVINGDSFDDIIVILKPVNRGFHIITFWPSTQDPDAHKSYTDPLVDTAMDGTPFDIGIVATQMHEKFRENAGVSPATLMKIIYDNESFLSKKKISEYAAELEASKNREDALLKRVTLTEKENEELRKSEAKAKEDFARLEQGSKLTPRPGTQVTESHDAVLEDVKRGLGPRNKETIFLYMSDGTVRMNNWERGMDSRFEFAQKLIGKRIRTDVWRDFPWQEWFQNIYLIEDED